MLKKILIIAASVSLLARTACIPTPVAPTTAAPTATQTQPRATGGIRVTDGGGSVVTWGPAPTPTAG